MQGYLLNFSHAIIHNSQNYPMTKQRREALTFEII